MDNKLVYVSREFHGSHDDDPIIRVFSTRENAVNYALFKGYSLTTVSQRIMRGYDGDDEIDIQIVAVD